MKKPQKTPSDSIRKNETGRITNIPDIESSLSKLSLKELRGLVHYFITEFDELVDHFPEILQGIVDETQRNVDDIKKDMHREAGKRLQENYSLDFEGAEEIKIIREISEEFWAKFMLEGTLANLTCQEYAEYERSIIALIQKIQGKIKVKSIISDIRAVIIGMIGGLVLSVVLPVTVAVVKAILESKKPIPQQIEE